MMIIPVKTDNKIFLLLMATQKVGSTASISNQWN